MDKTGEDWNGLNLGKFENVGRPFFNFIAGYVKMSFTQLENKRSRVACLNFKSSCVGSLSMFYVAVGNLKKGCRLSRFLFKWCCYFLGHVACRNLPWQSPLARGFAWFAVSFLLIHVHVLIMMCPMWDYAWHIFCLSTNFVTAFPSPINERCVMR